MVTWPASARTSTRPAISSKRSMPFLARPSPASTQPVPTLGWPANGISFLRLKMRTRAVFAGSAGGRTKVVSLRLNSAASDCMSASLRPRASGKTANGLPPKRRSVKTSTVTKAKLGIVGEELRQLGHRPDVADRLVLHLDGNVVTHGQIHQAIDRGREVGGLVARVAQVAEHAQPRGAQHGGDIEGMGQGIDGRAKRRIEGEIDLGPFRRLAGGRPFQHRRDEGRDLDVGLAQGLADALDFIERHAEQVLALDGAHVDPMNAVLGAEGDHL